MSNLKFTYLDKILHDINGPLHNISLLSELLSRDNTNMSKTDMIEYIKDIHESAGKLVRTINMLSSVTNLKTGKVNVQLAESDLISLVKKEISYHQRSKQQDQHIEIKLNSTIDSCKTLIDEYWFRQLLANLIMNAVNHSEKGMIEITTDITEKDGILHFSLSVKDEGCGIPEDEP